MSEEEKTAQQNVEDNAKKLIEEIVEEARDVEDPIEAEDEAETSEDDEINIFRSELSKTKEALEKAQAEAEDFKSKHMRALAEMQTIRRRVSGDVERARNQGADSVILSVIPVYDDLRRALEAAGEDQGRVGHGLE